MRRLTVFVCLLLLSMSVFVLPRQASAIIDIEIGNTSTTECATPTCTTISWGHTVSLVTENRLLVVGVAVDQAAGEDSSVSSVTFGGISLTRLRRVSGVQDPNLNAHSYAEAWYLLSPDDGLDTVTATFSEATRKPIAGAIDYGNVYQSDPFNIAGGGLNSAAGSGSSTSLSVTTTGTGLVMDLISPSTGNPNEGSGQTIRWSIVGTEAYGAVSTRVVTRTTTMSWSNFDYFAHIVAAIQSVSPSGDGGDGIGGGTSGGRPLVLIDDFKISCKLSPIDWLLVTAQPGHRNVSIEDLREEARLAISYVVLWGDGRGDISPTMPVNHTYDKDGVYNVTARVQYRGGGIDIFVSQVDVRDNNCALQMFARDYFPLLVAVTALSIVAAFIVTAARQRIKPSTKRMLRIVFLAVAFMALLVVATAAVYAIALGVTI